MPTNVILSNIFTAYFCPKRDNPCQSYNLWKDRHRPALLILATAQIYVDSKFVPASRKFASKNSNLPAAPKVVSAHKQLSEKK